MYYFSFCLAHYERLFKDLQTQVHGEAVTGLLLIYPVHIIHVLEVRQYFLWVSGASETLPVAGEGKVESKVIASTLNNNSSVCLVLVSFLDGVFILSF